MVDSNDCMVSSRCLIFILSSLISVCTAFFSAVDLFYLLYWMIHWKYHPHLTSEQVPEIQLCPSSCLWSEMLDQVRGASKLTECEVLSRLTEWKVLSTFDTPRPMLRDLQLRVIKFPWSLFPTLPTLRLLLNERDLEKFLVASASDGRLLGFFLRSISFDFLSISCSVI